MPPAETPISLADHIPQPLPLSLEALENRTMYHRTAGFSSYSPLLEVGATSEEKMFCFVFLKDLVPSSKHSPGSLGPSVITCVLSCNESLWCETGYKNTYNKNPNRMQNMRAERITAPRHKGLVCLFFLNEVFLQEYRQVWSTVSLLCSEKDSDGSPNASHSSHCIRCHFENTL